MNVKIIIGITIILSLLLAGFSKWKKKYGHKNTRCKAGTANSKAADLITQCYHKEAGKGDNPTVTGEVKFGEQTTTADRTKKASGKRPKKAAK